MAKISIDTGTQGNVTIDSLAGGDIQRAEVGDNAEAVAVGKQNQQRIEQGIEREGGFMSEGEEVLLRDIRTLLIGNPGMKQNGLIDEFRELREKLETYIDADHAWQEWRRDVERRLDALEFTFRAIIVLVALLAVGGMAWRFFH